jgi:hypothetical protein
MRRLAAIAAFALFLAVPLWAQHGGGHGGGGGHAGGFGGHAGGSISHSGSFSGSHANGFSGHAARSFSPPASTHNFSSRGYSGGPYLHHGGVGVRIGTYGYGNGCYGYLCRGNGYGYYPWGWGYYDPSWWWDNSSNDDSSQDVATAAEMNRENLEEQRMLRQEQSDGDQDSYSSRYDGPRRPYNGDPQTPEKKGAPIFANTVLVFRDKHEQEVENYAIVGDTLWSFAPQHTQKIALDDLDLAATKKANEDRGMTFSLPSGS